MSQGAGSDRSKVWRLPKRASYEREVIDAILDAGLICHVGIVEQGAPIVVPMGFARRGGELLLHGSSASRLMKALAAGVEACVVVTHLDGIVVARSGFHSSMNYRSVVVFGRPRAITDEREKREALNALVDHLIPGRAAELRPMTLEESKITTVVALPIDEASAKVRVGPPVDDEPDYALPVWGGVVPLRLAAGEPLADGRSAPEVPLPHSVGRLRRRFDEPPS
ncbi:MAG TPA: pyridoxamine 5'-phosphate oxidase family protein [Thermoanaerobaculia bacterium]|nr:pyridoxamine 5'-phosphate oxidase family protein [Thermoanaerobaculia bacterium]